MQTTLLRSLLALSFVFAVSNAAGCGGVRPGTQPEKAGSPLPPDPGRKTQMEGTNAPLINNPSAPLTNDPDKSPKDDSPNNTGPK